MLALTGPLGSPGRSQLPNSGPGRSRHPDTGVLTAPWTTQGCSGQPGPPPGAVCAQSPAAFPPSSAIMDHGGSGAGGPAGGPGACPEMPMGASALQHLHRVVGAPEAEADDEQREFDRVVTAALSQGVPPAGPTPPDTRPRESSGAAAEETPPPPPQLSTVATPPPDAPPPFVDDGFEHDYWRQIHESHVARQQEQWRKVLERAEAEEREMQSVRLRVEEEAKKERASIFLRQQGFVGVNARRRRYPVCGGFTYPLHIAVRLNYAAVVEGLVIAGADIDLQDSEKLTPVALAYKLNKCGSHDRLIVILQAASLATDTSPPPPPPPPAAPPPPSTPPKIAWHES